MWQALRNRNLKYKFRRQHPIGSFILDFYCAQAKLCIEIDGASHLEPLQAEYDEARTAFLEDARYSMIRFTNHDMRHDLHAVVEAIVGRIERILQES